MTASKPIDTVKKVLGDHGQGHLVGFWDQLDSAAREHLISQIDQLDMDEIDVWIAEFVTKAAFDSVPATFSPADFYPALPTDAISETRYHQAVTLGKELIAAGKVAAFVVAGGQGTRLGFDGPKGNFSISPINNKTLFQLFAEYIVAVENKYHTCCPWYIMTSPLNHCETLEIFRSNDYYGLDEKNVFFFQQGTLPNFSPDGRILLADKDLIACSPDGHGGSLKALYKSGAADDMKKRGVEIISYFQVDNPLINIFDPLFIGLHALDDAEMSSKTVIKACPTEKVGNFCLVDGKVTVIEYSDLSDEMAEKRNPDGSLVFQLGSIAIHLINRTFVEKLNAKGFSLPLHRALKKVPHIDADGNPVFPDKPNAVKLESFVFDALPLASKSIILETLRDQEFGPVKNATGTDSAETARQMIIDRAADWLESAGVKIPRTAYGKVDCVIEMAPSFAVSKEDVKEKADQVPPIKPGDSIYLD